MKRTEKTNRIRGRAIENNLYMLKLVWTICPSLIIFQTVFNLANQCVGLYYNLVFVRIIFNALQKQTDFKLIAVLILSLLLVLMLVDLLSNWYTEVIKPKKDQELSEGLNRLMFEKSVAVELACYENPEFYDKYTRASSEAGDRAVKVLNTATGFISSCFSMIFVTAFMFSIDRYAVLFTAIPVAIVYFTGKKLNRVNYELNMKNIPSARMKNYTQRVVYLNNFAKEIRTSNIFSVMVRNFNSACDEIIANTKEYGLVIALWSFANQFMTSIIVSVGSIIYATFRMLTLKNLLIGDYVVLINAITNLASSFGSLIGSITSFLEHSLYIDNLRVFLEYEPKISGNENGRMPQNGTIELKNVSFAYGAARKEAVKNVNMKINLGEKIAVVGRNGAGKSTLVKLLMRLYEVTDGEILLNGANIKEYNLKAYRDIYGTAFQDFQVMAATIAENVLMGELKDAEDEEKVKDALRKSGVYERVAALKNGINNMATKEFDEDGAVFSGGEYQKLAMARVMARDCGIVIVDEPSSSLDPIAESQIYETIMEVCKNRTVIFTSHRLSSTVTADKIYVFQDGRIVEEGRHRELMDMDGVYAGMFKKQAENYV